MALRCNLFLLIFFLFNGFLYSQLSSDNLLAYYPFDGNVLDLGPSGYHGIMVGGTFVANLDGAPNSAIRFNGINEYCDLTAFAEDFRVGLDQMTIYFLLKFESTVSDQTILSLGNSGETISNNVFEIEYENNQFQVETEIGNSATNTKLQIDQFANVVDFDWHEIFIRINGNSLEYCRDGQLIYSGSYIPTETTVDELFLGCFDGDGVNDCCHYNGIIDELQFYTTLRLEVQDTFTHTSCASEEFQISINNNVYDINNPSGIETIQSDCFRDTILTIALDFLPSYDSTITSSHCENDNYQIVVNQTIYDINNPSGIETLSSALGCDSIVNIDLTFFAALSEDIIQSHCEDDNFQITVNQTIYDINNPFGTEQMTTTNGCDSIINIDLSFFPSFSTQVIESHCESENYQIEINQTIYDINNPSGIELLSTANGCDSSVIIDLIFIEEIVNEFEMVVCDEDNYFIEINGTVYDKDNPAGVEIFNLSQCDSIVMIDLIFGETNTDSLSYIGCKGDEYSLLVNGVVYNESNPTGIEMIQNDLGCDSLIYIDLKYVDTSCDLYIPNILKTNADYPNNIFQVFTSSSCEFTVDKFFIFDRWGTTIYGSEQSVYWDGLFNGKKVKHGIYVYYMVLDTPCGSISKAGSLLLIN